MKLYKSPKNEVFAYDDDGSQDDLIPADYVQITNEEADVLRKQYNENQLNSRTNAEKIAACKSEAKQLLANSDWTALPDVTLTNQNEFIAYRAKLRNLVLNPVTDPVFEAEPTPIWATGTP